MINLKGVEKNSVNTTNNNNGTINTAVLGPDRFQNPNSAFYFNGTNSLLLKFILLQFLIK